MGISTLSHDRPAMAHDDPATYRKNPTDIMVVLRTSEGESYAILTLLNTSVKELKQEIAQRNVPRAVRQNLRKTRFPRQFRHNVARDKKTASLPLGATFGLCQNY